MNKIKNNKLVDNKTIIFADSHPNSYPIFNEYIRELIIINEYNIPLKSRYNLPLKPISFFFNAFNEMIIPATEGIIFTKKTHLHPKYSTINPPANEPVINPIPAYNIQIPKARPRISGLRYITKRAFAVAKSMAAPIP